MTHKKLRETLAMSVFLIMTAVFFGIINIQAKTRNIVVAQAANIPQISVAPSVTEVNGVIPSQAVVPPTEPVSAPVQYEANVSAPGTNSGNSAIQPAHPVQLEIPNARVDAHILNVGITSTGNLDVPPNFYEVGWYQYGTLPGQKGSAVLDGHVDNAASIDGVFKHLHDLIPGDDIYVTMDNGSKLHYIVKQASVYATSAFPADQVFHQDDAAYLKIITCHGTYIPSAGTYDQRLIVTAVLV